MHLFWFAILHQSDYVMVYGRAGVPDSRDLRNSTVPQDNKYVDNSYPDKEEIPATDKGGNS